MGKQLVLILSGILLIIFVVFLGFRSGGGVYVIWFGLACTVIAPIGLSLISSAFKTKQNNSLKKLLKVSEINELINKAETQEEKIKILENERKQLIDKVRYETTKYATLERKKHLENEAERILKDLKLVDSEIEKLQLESVGDQASNEALVMLYKRLENNRNNLMTSMSFRGLTLTVVPGPLFAFVEWMFNSLKEKNERRKIVKGKEIIEQEESG